jgi:hypothetical protein
VAAGVPAALAFSGAVPVGLPGGGFGSVGGGSGSVGGGSGSVAGGSGSVAGASGPVGGEGAGDTTATTNGGAS